MFYIRIKSRLRIKLIKTNLSKIMNRPEKGDDKEEDNLTTDCVQVQINLQLNTFLFPYALKKSSHT